MSNKKRKIALAKLIKEAELDKLAQTAINDASSAEDSGDFGHKVFQSLLEGLEIEGLDEELNK